MNNDADPMDDNGHGTHVAGILAAEKNGYLVVGVAPRSTCTRSRSSTRAATGDDSNLILALQWAVDHGSTSSNMSLGTHEISPALQTAVTNASAAGAPDGRRGRQQRRRSRSYSGLPGRLPGAYPQVLSTTFTNQNDALTGYSCTGPEVDFASPGDNIFSPVPVGTVPCSAHPTATRR